LKKIDKESFVFAIGFVNCLNKKNSEIVLSDFFNFKELLEQDKSLFAFFTKSSFF